MTIAHVATPTTDSRSPPRGPARRTRPPAPLHAKTARAEDKAERAPSVPLEAEVNAAREAASLHCEVGGLVYVDDRAPGFTRRMWRGKLHYFDTKGRRITDDEDLRRIRALAIPPAYTNVWICPDPSGHIQATGRDARGRKQYRYHERWHAVRDADKYGQLTQFARTLPRIRRTIEAGIALSGLHQEKVLAVVVKLLETTLIRVGTRAYARTNKSYGLTTLKRRHATVKGERIRLRFRGKSGVEHDVTVNDRRIARVVRTCMEIPGHALFHYLDDTGGAHAIDSGAVNAYLQRIGKADFTAKHYRTWAGSVFAMAALQRRPWENVTTARRMVVEVIKEVAQRLGNTPAVCRACYVHPRIIDSYLRGDLPAPSAVSGPRGLNADERRLLAFLESPDTGTQLPDSAV